MKKSILSTLIGVAAISAATSAMAAAPAITDVNNGSSYSIKYIAYEMYNNVTGVNANNVNFFARLAGDVSKGDSVNIKGYNAKANLGSGNLFLLGKTDNIAVNNASLGVSTTAVNNHPITTNGAIALNGRANAGVIGLAAGGLCANAVTGFNSPLPIETYAVVADSTATGVQEQITMLGVDLGTFCARNTGNAVIGAAASGAGLTTTDKVMVMTPLGGNTWVSTAQGALSNNGGSDIGRVVPTVTFGINLNVVENLNPTCTVPKNIDLHLVTNQETINPTTVLQIIPQFVATPSTTAMQQELSTNDDFKQFIDGANNIYSIYNRSLGFGGTMYSLLDRQFSGTALTNPYKDMFRSFVPQTANASLDFALTSMSPEPGVTLSYYDWTAVATACTKDATNKIFNCSTGIGTTKQLTDPGVAISPDSVNLPGTSNTLSVANNTASEMAPTAWTTTAFNFKINGVQDICASALGSAGNWYGGIEAIVPFVKSDSSSGYATYIKLFNRYIKPAKLYVANMNQITDSIVTSITQLPAPNNEIPVNGTITISGDNLLTANGGVFSAAEEQYGAPVKFLIRVPAQAGAPAFTTLTDHPVVPILNAGSAAGVATASIVDPYITGVVVQVVPGGSQRSISLMFKSFKQGQYHVN